MVFGTTQRRQLLLPCLGIGLLLVILSQNRSMRRKLRHKAKLLEVQSAQSNVEKGLVVAKQRAESIHWVWDLYPSWHPYIYSTSDPPEQGYLTIPTTQGLEPTAFLTFIIDYYDTLPDYTVFLSSAQETPLATEHSHPTTSSLETVHLNTVKAQGYANLQCTHESDCATFLNPQSTTKPDIETEAQVEAEDEKAESALRRIYSTLFNVTEQDIPSQIKAPQSSQFIVTRARIQYRHREDYKRMREWAVHWNETDSLKVTEVFARLWHVVFGMPAVYCPSYEQCRCELFQECAEGHQRLERYYVPLVRGVNPWFGRWLGRWVGG